MKRSLTIVLFAALCAWPVVVSAEQIVVLDFDTFTDGTSDDGKDWSYSPSERTAIIGGLNDKFAPFPVTFTDIVPPDGIASTVFFNTGLASAGDIDFQNKKKIDDASIHIPKLLEIALVSEPFLPDDVVAASINIAAHETLHLLGTRHHDSFTLIGEGVPSPSVAALFDPAYAGPTFAALSGKDLNSLTTSPVGGFSAAKLLDPDLFIGPRSGVKLLLEEFVDLDEDSDDVNTPMTPQVLELKTIPIPNMLPPPPPPPPPGPGEDPPPPPPEILFFADVVVVEEASITLGDPPFDMFPESDYYEVFFEEGDIVFIEVLSDILDFRLDTFNTAVGLLTPFSAGLAAVAVNDNEPESTDSLIIDAIIPATGPYVIEVFSSPDATTPAEGLGDYEMLIYRFRTEVVPEPTSLTMMGVTMSGLLLRRRRAVKVQSQIEFN